MSMKTSNDTIGNRTRDLPTCGAVPQPTAPPHAPLFWVGVSFLGRKGQYALRGDHIICNLPGVHMAII